MEIHELGNMVHLKKDAFGHGFVLVSDGLSFLPWACDHMSDLAEVSTCASQLAGFWLEWSRDSVQPKCHCWRLE